jgi:hypothetical protein
MVSNFDAGGQMLRSQHMNSCLAAQKTFFVVYRTGVLQKIFQIGGIVEYLKVYPLIPLTPPLLGHFAGHLS